MGVVKTLRDAPEAKSEEELNEIEGKAHAALTRADRAKLILDDVLVQDAFTGIRDALMGDWKATGPDAAPRREDIWRSYALLELLENAFKRHIQGGVIARNELTAVQKKRKWFQR